MWPRELRDPNFLWQKLCTYRSMVEFQETLKQECPVWLEVECNQSILWSLFYLTIQKLGKILVPSNANAFNRYHMCILWNIVVKRPSYLQIDRRSCRHATTVFWAQTRDFGWTSLFPI